MRAFGESFHSKRERIRFLDDVKQPFFFCLFHDTPLYSNRNPSEQTPNIQLHTVRIADIYIYLLNIIVN